MSHVRSTTNATRPPASQSARRNLLWKIRSDGTCPEIPTKTRTTIKRRSRGSPRERPCTNEPDQHNMLILSCSTMATFAVAYPLRFAKVYMRGHVTGRIHRKQGGGSARGSEDKRGQEGTRVKTSRGRKEQSLARANMHELPHTCLAARLRNTLPALHPPFRAPR